MFYQFCHCIKRQSVCKLQFTRKMFPRCLKVKRIKGSYCSSISQHLLILSSSAAWNTVILLNKQTNPKTHAYTKNTTPPPNLSISHISMIQHRSWSHATVLKHCSAAQRGSADGWVDAPAQEVGAEPYPHGAHLACLPKKPPPTKKPSAVPKGEGRTTLGLENSSPVLEQLCPMPSFTWAGFHPGLRGEKLQQKSSPQYTLCEQQEVSL